VVFQCRDEKPHFETERTLGDVLCLVVVCIHNAANRETPQDGSYRRECRTALTVKDCEIAETAELLKRLLVLMRRCHRVVIC